MKPRNLFFYQMSFQYFNNLFDVTKKKSKEHYMLLVSSKAQFPNHTANLKRDFGQFYGGSHCKL